MVKLDSKHSVELLNQVPDPSLYQVPIPVVDQVTVPLVMTTPPITYVSSSYTCVDYSDTVEV